MCKLDPELKNTVYKMFSKGHSPLDIIQELELVIEENSVYGCYGAYQKKVKRLVNSLESDKIELDEIHREETEAFLEISKAIQNYISIIKKNKNAKSSKYNILKEIITHQLESGKIIDNNILKLIFSNRRLTKNIESIRSSVKDRMPAIEGSVNKIKKLIEKQEEDFDQELVGNNYLTRKETALYFKGNTKTDEIYTGLVDILGGKND